MNIFKIKSRIFFNGSSKRDLPILDGYKPLFDYFHKRFKVSGKILFIDDLKELNKGNNKIVIIYLPEYDENEINVYIGDKFSFYEGENLIGEGLILEIIK